MSQRLERQIRFILEIDKLKNVLRRSYIAGGARQENSAEHSWHLAVMAIVLAEHADTPFDICRVVRMAVIHDLVEIDAGDTFCYDREGNADKREREEAAADRIFGLLPDDQAEELRSLWDEFERGETPEAKFANAIDRLMPLMHNYHSQGRTWLEHDVVREQVIERNSPIGKGSGALWEFARELIDDAVEKNYLR